MKYLKSFNESNDTTIEDIFHLYLPIIDKYNLTQASNSHYLMAFYDKNISLEIKKAYVLDQDVWIVAVQNNMKSLYGKGYEQLQDTQLVGMLKDTSEACAELLDSKDIFVGNFKGCLEVIFFPEKANIKKYKGCEFYGSNAIVEMTNGCFLHSNVVSHKNCFDIYESGRICGMYAIMGYYEGWFYYNPISIIAGNKYDKIVSEKWLEVCTELNIKNGQKVRKHFKITVPEFMYRLKDIKKIG